jgi:hypothetical protein
MLNLRRAICELHNYDQADETTPIGRLKGRGFKNFAIKFVQAVYS